MPNIKIAPKCFAFLVPTLLSLAFLTALGCGGSNNKDAPPPARNQEAGIASIIVSKGWLTPAYSDDVKVYELSTVYDAAPNFTVTVTLKDPKASLTIDGRSATSGQPFLLNLPEGNFTFQVAVKSEDGEIPNTISIATNRTQPNTTVYVYDYISGNPLDGAKLALRDATTNELLASDIDFPISAQGTVFLGLEKDRRYNIYARRHDTAEACFANFDPGRESTVTLYSRKDYIKVFPASAPIITDVAFSFMPVPQEWQNAVWESVSLGGNYVERSSDKLQLLRVTAMAESYLEVTQGGTRSILVGIDDMPTPHQSEIQASAVGDLNKPVIINGRRYFETAYYYVLSDAVAHGEHFLSMVVYDWANNRTEQRIYLNITNESANTNADISNEKPVWSQHSTAVYGTSYSGYSTGPIGSINDEVASLPPDPVGPYGDTIQVYFYLRVQTKDYRWYEMERSTSPTGPFKVVGKQAYVYIDPYSSGIRGYDSSAELVGGVTYYYRLKLYNNNSESQYSEISAITIPPSFNVNLVSPANQGISNTLRPAFRFRVTNETLLDSEMSDYGAFTLFVRNKIGTIAIRARFQVDFGAIDAEGNPMMLMEYPYGSDRSYGVEDPALAFAWIEDNGIFVIDTNRISRLSLGGQPLDIGYFEPGMTYEWSVFGGDASANSNWNSDIAHAMYFVKVQGTNPDKWSQTYASSRDQGSGATNGYFTLIMHPAAE